MRLTPGEVLHKLAGHERELAEQKITALAQERLTLQQRKEEVSNTIMQLNLQRTQKLNQGARASTLHGFEAENQIQKEQSNDIDASMEKLRMQEQQLLREWLAHDQKQKVFKKLTVQNEMRVKRIGERRQQQQVDDTRAARLLRSRHS